jgi:hypothetical protein
MDFSYRWSIYFCTLGFFHTFPMTGPGAFQETVSENERFKPRSGLAAAVEAVVVFAVGPPETDVLATGLGGAEVEAEGIGS